MESIVVSPDGKKFFLSKSQTVFAPRGFNYDRDYKMRLLEEYWESEWHTVAGDFAEMKALGANVVRIHLQFARFMDGPDQPNRRSLRRLQKLLSLAERTGLYLDVTGLACYRKADVPAWFDMLDEEERWKAQANFWKAVARCCAKSPAVFCYDLINEPVVPAGPSTTWLVGQLAGFYYVQAISLDPHGRSRPAMARAWISQLSAAIRHEDKRHLITVGLLPNSAELQNGSGFLPSEIGSGLDFISVHLYPRGGHLAEDLENLRLFSVGKPLLIEETFPITASATELKRFLEASAPIANGWLGFYWGRPVAELRDSQDIGDRVLLAWLTVFQELTRQPPPAP